MMSAFEPYPWENGKDGHSTPTDQATFQAAEVAFAAWVEANFSKGIAPAEVTVGIPLNVIGPVTDGVIPGQFISNGNEEEQHLIQFEAGIAKGAVKLTVLHNQNPIPELTGLSLTSAQDISVTLATPLELSTADEIDLEITEAEEEPEDLKSTAFDRHTT